MGHSGVVPAALVLASCGIALVPTVPGFAQSHTLPVQDTRHTALIAADFTSLAVVRVYEPHSVAAVSIPDNLQIAGMYLPLVDTMLRRSATFRRQAQRIGGARGLTVVIQRGHGNVTARVRARTQLTTLSIGRLRATVEILAMQDHAELIAHEIEHVIEQLDGVDLRSRASQASSGVRHCDGGSFDTLRAVRAGTAVAEEVRTNGG